jgi:hypothetical protein
MRFERIIRQAAKTVKANARGVDRPVIADVQRAKHNRRGLSAVLLGFTATIAVIGGGVVLLGTPVGSVSTTAPSGAGQAAGPTVPAAPGEDPPFVDRGWSIEYSPDWFRADSELMPDKELDSLTLATFPLAPGTIKCGLLPEEALLDIDADDSLVSILFGSSLPGDASPWPAQGFNNEIFAQSSIVTDVLKCSERPDIQLFLGKWLLDGNELTILVVFGSDVPSEVQTQAWDILFSLRAGQQTVAQGERVCIATRPPLPGFVPPEPYRATPTDETFALYGTAELWTQLPIDGQHVPTKGAWWSDSFAGGTVEEEPEIVVTWRRLDTEAPLVRTTELGGNAFTTEDGWFMLQGIWPEPSGCWNITATYRGTSLSYVTQVP